jgi:triosephosphate isomerase
MSTRKFVIGGNWKCNGSRSSVEALVKLLNEGGTFPSNAEVVCSPPSIFLDYVLANIRPDIIVASQNVAKSPVPGAFTGEIVAPMLKEFGINWTLTGHSERRAMEGETSEVVANKSKVAINAGMTVIFCCGETLAEREADRTMSVINDDQIAALVAALAPEDWDKIVIAYEPVWAIGTGKVATPEQAQEVHQNIRSYLSSAVSPDVAAKTRIIYGGSVKGSSAAGLGACPDIDGFLVGGASLTADFITIINAVEGL